jgi:hypothetical protein
MDVDTLIDFGLEVLKLEKLSPTEIFKDKDLRNELAKTVDKFRRVGSFPELLPLKVRFLILLRRYTNHLLETDEGYTRFRDSLIDCLAMLQVIDLYDIQEKIPNEDLMYIYLDGFYDYLVEFCVNNIRDKDFEMAIDFIDFYQSGLEDAEYDYDNTTD